MGETRSGDTVVVRHEGDLTLVAVIDVLGHGARAADVADRAEAHLHEVALGHDAHRLMESLHHALRGTRGAAATFYLFERGRIRGCGIGNVELRTQGSSVPVFLNPGIIGQNVRQIRTFEADLRPGDRMILFSDGISSRADLNRVRNLTPDIACRTMFSEHRKAHDDATLVIADVEPVGRAPAPSLR